MYQPESEKRILQNVRAWRPVMHRSTHTIDVFGEGELTPWAGGAGFVQKLSEYNIHAQIVTDSWTIAINVGRKNLKATDVVIKHDIGDNVHEVYKKLGLRKEGMIIPG